VTLNLTESLADRLGRFGDALAAVDDRGGSIRYDELVARADTLGATLGAKPKLVLLEGGSCIGWLIAYVACLRGRHPMLIAPAGAHETIAHFEQLFSPAVRITAAGDWQAEPTGRTSPALHPELALLLSTSGSTGSTKCVRLSARNMTANAASIAEYLGLGPDERGTVNLPTHYSYGLSIVNSHLFAGATILLTDKSVIDKAFWAFLREHEATSFAGVPHIYDLLQRIDLAASAPPSLRYFTQAGGRLAADMVARFITLAADHGWRFFVMYGQTEATARIAYLPPEQAAANPGSIGVAVPGGGRIALLNEDGEEVALGEVGEIVYFGPNVMMGYATGPDDLALDPGPERLATGDLGRSNKRGLLEITGRKSRFIKIFGNRIGLDDIETLLSIEGYSAIATGIDDQLLIVTRDADAATPIAAVLARILKLPTAYFTVRVVEEYPLLASGKVDYASLKASIEPAVTETVGGSLEGPVGPDAVEEAFKSVFGEAAEDRSANFNSLGGDSLNYVLVVMALEKCLPHIPDNWEAMSIDALTALAEARDMTPDGKGSSTSNLLRKLATIDVARGLCMLLVVVMHVDEVHFSQVVAPGKIAHIWDLITSIAKPMRMPTFFLISGVLVGQAVWRPWREIARGRFFFLLYLFVLWTTIITVNVAIAARLIAGEWHIGEFVGRWAESLILPQSLLWFLYALLAYFLAARLMRNWPLWLSLGLATILSAVSADLVGPPITYIARSLLFYLIGAYLPRVVDAVSQRASWPAVIGLGAVYLASCFLVKVAGEFVVGIWLPASVTGICLGLALSHRLADTPLGRPLTFVGRHTLPIYLLHQILVRDWHEVITRPGAPLLAKLLGNKLICATYPIFLDTAIILLSLGIYVVLMRIGLRWLFELPPMLLRKSSVPVRTEVVV